jgi:hypothetical protein
MSTRSSTIPVTSRSGLLYGGGGGWAGAAAAGRRVLTGLRVGAGFVATGAGARLALPAGHPVAALLGAGDRPSAAAGRCPEAAAGAGAGQEVTAKAAPAPPITVMLAAITVTAGARRSADEIGERLRCRDCRVCRAAWRPDGLRCRACW